jgi:DDE superfamily endonuclease
MDLQAQRSETRFSAYVEGLVSVIGHADRAKPLRDYCLGLMMPCERKSVEPMAAVTAPERTAAQHQSLLHFVGEGRWSDEKVLAKVQEMVLPAIERHRADRGMDHRRHGLSQKGHAFGGGGAAILRSTRQAGQLPGRGIAVSFLRTLRRSMDARVKRAHDDQTSGCTEPISTGGQTVVGSLGNPTLPTGPSQSPIR